MGTARNTGRSSRDRMVTLRRSSALNGAKRDYTGLVDCRSGGTQARGHLSENWRRWSRIRVTNRERTALGEKNPMQKGRSQDFGPHRRDEDFLGERDGCGLVNENVF